MGLKSNEVSHSNLGAEGRIQGGVQGGDPFWESADNFFYMKSIQNKIPNFKITVNGRNVSRSLLGFSYEEGSEYYKKLIYPSRRRLTIRSTALFNKRDEVVVKIFYQGNSSQNPLVFYNALDKALAFSGIITKRRSVLRSKNNPLKVYEYEMEETHLNKLDFKLDYESGMPVARVLEKIPAISKVVLPIADIAFKSGGKGKTLVAILKDLEEYLYYRTGVGVLLFQGNVLRWENQEAFLELTGEDVMNDMELEDDDENTIKAAYIGEDEFRDGDFSTLSVAKNFDGTYRNLVSGVCVNDRSLLDINIGKIEKKQNVFLAEEEKRDFLITLKDKKIKQHHFHLLPKYIFTALGTKVHFFHEEVAMKTILIKKTLAMSLNKYALKFFVLEYETASKQPIAGSDYDSGVNYP